MGRVRQKNLRFSVQRHLARAEHYDLRLEFNGVALSWAVPKGPSFNSADKRLAVRVEDHPVSYMDFEGSIPKGEYGGGTVMLWDEGEWTPHGDPAKGLKEGSLKFRLNGQRLKGDWALVKMKSQNGEPWLLIKEKDEFAKTAAGISRFTRGVRTGRSMAEIARGKPAAKDISTHNSLNAQNADKGAENPFKTASVMLAKHCDKLPRGGEWLYELKYDGFRVLAFSQNGETRLLSRNGCDCTKKFSKAAKAVSELLKGRAAVLDGEMTVAGENGIPDFSALQAYAKNKSGGGLNYVLFDLLALDGEDLRNLPLCGRKEKLKKLLKGAPATLSYSGHTFKMTESSLKILKEKGIEGVVAKDKNSAYVGGGNDSWLKLKFRNCEEFVIGGYKLSEDGKLKSLLVGAYSGGNLKFFGCVGTGFGAEDKEKILSKLQKIRRKTSPFYGMPNTFNEGAVFVSPKYAAQTEFAALTSSGLLRQASFLGMREDKGIKEINDGWAEAVKSTPAPKDVKSGPSGLHVSVAGVAVSHPDKKMFTGPDITKLELIGYYAAVAEKILPYIKDRFISAVCCPSGTDGEKFFLRHLSKDFPGIKKSPAEEGEYFYPTTKNAIIYLAQNNAVEFHVWASKKGSPRRPDVMVFDLDPDEGLDLEKVRRGVEDLKEVLNGLGLKSFLKTSGGKGYHIVVPFKNGINGKVFRDFSKGVAELLEGRFPDRYTSDISKKARRGKIFIDWQRNSPGATDVAPYSVRARRGAPVSMPISWEELYKIAPASVTLADAAERSETDPWADFFAVKASQSLTNKKLF